MPYLPVTVPSGNFTPGAQASLEFAAALINAAWEQANTKSTAFEGKISALDSWLNPATSPTMSAASVAEPTVIEPAVTIPATVTQTDILDTFDTKYMELVQLLSDKFVAFRCCGELASGCGCRSGERHSVFCFRPSLGR